MFSLTTPSLVSKNVSTPKGAMSIPESTSKFFAHAHTCTFWTDQCSDRGKYYCSLLNLGDGHTDCHCTDRYLHGDDNMSLRCFRDGSGARQSVIASCWDGGSVEPKMCLGGGDSPK